MKKLLFVLCLCAASTALAQTPTATATATDSPTATPTATASATATATGTPVPTPTPYSVITRQDTQGQKKPLEMQQVDADRVTVTNDGLAAKVSGPQDVNTSSDTQFFRVYATFVHMNVDQLDVGCYSLLFPLAPALSCSEYVNGGYMRIVAGAGSSNYAEEDTSLLTAGRSQKRPDKDGTLAMLDDIPNLSGITDNVVPKSDNAGGFTDSSITDDGTGLHLNGRDVFLDQYTDNGIVTTESGSGHIAILNAAGLSAFLGLGYFPVIRAAGRFTAQTAAKGTVVTYTNGASDGSFEISGNVLVTTATVHSFTETISYTDEGNTTRVVTMQFSTVAGAFVTAMTNAQGAVPYEGVPLHIRAKASTAITVGTTGTFTSVVYNVEGIIKQTK